MTKRIQIAEYWKDGFVIAIRKSCKIHTLCLNNFVLKNNSNTNTSSSSIANKLKAKVQNDWQMVAKNETLETHQSTTESV